MTAARAQISDGNYLAELPCMASGSARICQDCQRRLRQDCLDRSRPFPPPQKNVQTMDDHKRQKACSRLSVSRDEDTVLENSPTFSI